MILAHGIIDGVEVEAIFLSVESARLAGYEVIETKAVGDAADQEAEDDDLAAAERSAESSLGAEAEGKAGTVGGSPPPP